MRQPRRKRPRLGRHIRHLRTAGQWQPVSTGYGIGKDVTPRKFLGLHQLSFHAKGDSMRNKPPGPNGCIQALAALRRLPRPIFQHPLHHPPGTRPDKLLLRWQVLGLIHEIECAIDHCRPVITQPIFHPVREADVEVRLANDDDFFDRSRGGFLRGGRSARCGLGRRQDCQRSQQQSSEEGSFYIHGGI